MFKVFFILVAALMVTIMGICCILLRKRDTNLKKMLFRLNCAAIATTLFYINSLCNFSYEVSMLYSGLYSASILWLLLFFIDYLFELTETSMDARSVRIFRRSTRGIAVFDTISLLVNVFTGRIFTIDPALVDGEFYCWSINYTLYFNIHLGLSYVLVLLIFYILIKKIIVTNKFYRTKYQVIFLVFFIAVAIDALYVFWRSKIDISVLTYGFFSISACYFTIFSVPRTIERKMLDLVTENMTNAVLCFDANKKCIYSNKMGQNLFTDDDSRIAELDDVLKTGREMVFRDIKLTIDGIEKTLSEEFHVIRDSNSRLLGYFIILDDITKELSVLKEEKFRSTHDRLTGLYNREKFFSEAEKIIKQDFQTQKFLVTIDIENFKLVNDLFGVSLGDIVLKKQAEMLLRPEFEKAIKGRISGDKFAMLLDKDDFNSMEMEQYIKDIQTITAQFNYKIRINLGIYEISDPYESVSVMYDKANLAIKNKGRDQIISYYDTSILERLIEQKNVVSAFNSALQDNQFDMFLQPQVTSKTEKVVGAEALVRWIHPEKGIIYPGSFVGTLEEAGFLYKLDEYIWEMAAKKLADWKARNIDMHIAVNISAKDFYHLDLFKVFTGLVEKYDINPAKLKLEITETVLMHDVKLHIAVLSELQNYGFSIEMDDFGSGYSSLNMLKTISVDILKIDMAFLKKTENSERSKKILNSIIKMSKKLGITVITEGVEDEVHADFLKDAGCDYFQGYLYSKPVSVAEFERKFIK